MKLGSIQRKILVSESVGFSLIIAISWLDELVHLSGWLFGKEHTSNWQESALESVVVLLVALPILWITRKLARRLHYLEGFLKMCAWCRKVEDQGHWVSIEGYMEANLDTRTSHGVCPQCHANLLEQVKSRRSVASSRSR